MTIRSLTNQIIGLARDFKKSLRDNAKRNTPVQFPATVWKHTIMKDLQETGYFTDVAIENFAEALVLLMEDSDPKRKANEPERPTGS